MTPRWQWWVHHELKKRGLPVWFDPQPFAAHASATDIRLFGYEF